MPRRGNKKIVMVKGCEAAMNAFQLEVAQELGLAEKMSGDGGYRNLSTFEAGTLGGTMVRKVQAMGETMIKDRFDKGLRPLIPSELAPDEGLMRNMTNNGNDVVDGKIKYTRDEA